MASKWCLLQKYVDEFKRGLKSGEIKPEELSKMSSAERRSFFAKYVGETNAENVNALFESKLLLKNQKAGYISWAKKVAGISKQTRQDILSKIERLDTVLSPKAEQQFLEDLVATKLNINVTEAEAKNIFELSKRNQELSTKWKEELDQHPAWSENPLATQKEWMTNETRLNSGYAKVQLENYINELKLNSRKIYFKEEPFKKIAEMVGNIPGTLKSSVASFDNSLWGRQGIKTLLDVRTSNIWFKNFLKSWKDIGQQLISKGGILKSGDDRVMDMIKADIYSRPNAMNGKYNAGDYRLSVLNEEAFPSSIPEKIPLFGRLFKASEVAYNGGALRLRADLADRFISKAEKAGVNTLGEEAKAIGHLVGSMTGRGSWGKADVLGKEANVLFFSVKFLKSNIDTLTAGLTDKKIRQSPFARKQAATNLLNIIGTLTFIYTLNNLFRPDDEVEKDPRSSKFGKIKIFNRLVDLSGGMASIVTLASRLLPTVHNGKLSFWKIDTNGEYVDLVEGGYGKQNAMDVFDSFFQGKFSPIAGIVRDMWKGTTYTGEPISVKTVAKGQLPISIQNALFDSYKLGNLILDGLGFSVSSFIEPNKDSNIIPEDKKIDNQTFIKTVLLYANAFGTDPETAFNRIFTGQKIRKISGDAIIVERLPVSESQAIKSKYGAKNPEMKLDHTIPLILGGSNTEDNLKIVTTSEWSSYTKVETALGKALKEKKITKKEAQEEIVKFKAIKDTSKRKAYGEELIAKYK
jgi:hypothetical protein